MNHRPSLSWVLSLILLLLSPPARGESAQAWYRQGRAEIDAHLRDLERLAELGSRPARNVILFVGDGMGVSTVTAARIHAGQKRGGPGEEHLLSFERFPHLALAKTYNTNQQVADSAGTMSAMMTGAKTKAGLISVSQAVVRGDCSTQAGEELTTALQYAELAGMATGVVTTARLTHATPAATYAHAMDRDFESDADASRLANSGDCIDIARQLVELPARFGGRADGLEVALGGGRRAFLPATPGSDPETGEAGHRTDGRDLTAEWLQRYPDSAYVWNLEQFTAVDSRRVRHLLGLFEPSHMRYEQDRANDLAGEPSLAAMTDKALDILERYAGGFLLVVEGARIDHAHHASSPHAALEETLAFDAAVTRAVERTDSDETLIIVTADHSHVFTLAGYPTRGNPILGKVVGNDRSGAPLKQPALAADGLPYTSVGYVTGRGHRLSDGTDPSWIYEQPLAPGRADLREVNTQTAGFHAESLVPMSSETHGGEDVAIYAQGPGAALVSGVLEQHAIYHVINVAADLEGRARRGADH